MKKRFVVFIALAVSLLLLSTMTVYSNPPEDPRSAFNRVNWQKGPCKGDIGSLASIDVPPGCLFAGKEDGRFITEKVLQDISSGHEVGFIFADNWIIAFEFDETGYVKDDEKNSLDANAMLKSIRESNEETNKERKRRGIPTLEVVGWARQPFYNPNTNNLEWAIQGRDEGGQLIVNYNTRYLGRKGVMQVTLASDPSILDSILPDFRELMKSFNFNKGQKYTEFVQGDKVAEYGLTALVVGGAAAAAAKGGFFKWAWKILVGIGIAILAFAKKIFNAIFGRRPEV